MSSRTTPVQYRFSQRNIDCYFDEGFALIESIVPKEKLIFITDENVFREHKNKFSSCRTIVIKAGEQFKNQQTVDTVIDELISSNADRQSFIVGVGGGVVTDLAGFVASVYMRGIKFAFVPTSVLAMVDASVGGKNGIDVGVYKNLVGTINQPEFLLYDYSFLETLPEEEWVNGFAEIVKHACIKDSDMFAFLEENSLPFFRSSLSVAGSLIRKNVEIKYNVVSRDENETGERKLLNFGHTIGHAIENTSKLPHGSAISIGMVIACRISEKINGFASADTEKIISLLKQYNLPAQLSFDKEEAWKILQHDKKKSGNEMSFIVLDSIGMASVRAIPMEELYKIFKDIT
ncbi:MAG: 3-dehydroquinate synthase [Ginsengibacter sp.]